MRHEGVQAVRDTVLVDEFLDGLRCEAGALLGLLRDGRCGLFYGCDGCGDNLDGGKGQRDREGDGGDAGAIYK